MSDFMNEVVPHHTSTTLEDARQWNRHLEEEIRKLRQELSEANYWRERHCKDSADYGLQAQNNWETVKKLEKENTQLAKALEERNKQLETITVQCEDITYSYLQCRAENVRLASEINTKKQFLDGMNSREQSMRVHLNSIRMPLRELLAPTIEILQRIDDEPYGICNDCAALRNELSRLRSICNPIECEEGITGMYD